MPLVARAVFLVLVGATFSAFFVAQRLKSTPPVIDVNGLARFFSPNGDGVRDANGFTVVLKVPDDVTVDVVNLDGDRIKRLAEARPARAYSPMRLSWDGSTDEGARVPDRWVVLQVHAWQAALLLRQDLVLVVQVLVRRLEQDTVKLELP